MRTTTRVHTPAERVKARRAGEIRARTVLVQLLCIVSVLRTILTRIVPLAGCSSWWIALLCLLPGAAVYGLLRFAMRITHTGTLTDCLRRCVGGVGGWCVSLLLGVLLLIDGTASMTALITMFTEGVGTQGTQMTLALLTSAVLLTCLHREGLARGAYLLRHVMLGAALLAAAFSVRDVHPDGLFPLMGEGVPAIRAALAAGVSLAWPVVLLLTLPADLPEKRVRLAAAVAAACIAVPLALTLTIPHELLIREHELAGSMLLPTLFALPAVRTLLQCLLMLALFLAVGGAVQMATDQICAPMGQPPRWLPYAVLALLTASQALDIRSLWQMLGRAEPWLLLPLAVLAGMCILIALFRREKA
ncbi:MAG: hypothetical protein IJZ74_08130 [Clostridia bacterium]|nr:hypothetical protein [Clostridia bacterium]